jgi:hypothetical protein
VTQVGEPLTQSPGPGGSPVAPPSRRPRNLDAGRWPVVIALIVSLVLCGFSSEWASDWKVRNGGAQSQEAARGALSGMDSYALALMLGGLRGPLVMVLWSKVENQKIGRDLEDIDTMIEWIRLLQPEFDTVHIFQIWNKAYNLSVMMASPASKYTTILDAVDYGRRVLADRPGDLNVLDSLAQVYSEKLGGPNVTERQFYRKQFREDSLTAANRKTAYPEDDARYRRLGIKYLSSQNGPLLDEHNNILPQLLIKRFDRPSDLPPGSEWNDGQELQYLKDYQPFPYGIPPNAMGYNYAKQAQVAMTVGGQKPVQMSDTVIDSRPGLILKQWSQIEADRGIVYEAGAFAVHGEENAMDAATASIALNAKPANVHDLNAAVYSYGLSAKVCAHALREYARHLDNTQYVNSYQVYTSHIDELKSLEAMSTADHAYLAALVPGANRQELLMEAAEAYRAARAGYERMLLTYYTIEPIAAELYRNKKIDLKTLDEETLNRMYEQMLADLQKIPSDQRQFDDERNQNGAYIYRADIRLSQLKAYDRNQPSIMRTH